MPVAKDRREPPRKKHKVSLSSALSAGAILVVGVMMIVGIVVKGRKAKGSCIFDQATRTMYCRHKAVEALPSLPADLVSLQIGDRGEKVEHRLKALQRVNFSGLSELTDVRLVKCQIETIGDATFSDLSQLRSLDLSHNKLQVLPPTSFQGLTELVFLNLSSNPLHRLEAPMFNGIKIDHLLLANNPALTELSPETFRGAEIRELSINRCDLPSLDAFLFSPLYSSLRELRITHNQRELTVPYKTFTSLELSLLDLTNSRLRNVGFLSHLHAEVLILDDNPLEDINYLQKGAGLKHTLHLSLRNVGLKQIQKKDLANYLSGLEHLDLSQNHLQVLNAGVFGALAQLKVLRLEDNVLSDLEGEFDQSVLSSLQSLYLHDNQITRLDEELKGLFSRLETISLHDNPFHCNCQWLWQLLKDKKSTVQQPQSVSCLTPQKENITKLLSSHLQCQKPVILNATLDTDRLSVTCTAEGDPAPILTWITPQGSQSRSPASPVIATTTGSPQSTSSLPVTRPGNYTCVAENVAGKDQVIINTETMTTNGLRLRLQSKQIKILETKEGFFITCVLIFILGCIFRNS